MQFSISNEYSFIICDVPPTSFGPYKAIIGVVLYEGIKVQQILSKMCMRRVKIPYYQFKLLNIYLLTYLGCSISYQFSNDVEFKLAKFLQLIDTIRELFLGK